MVALIVALALLVGHGHAQKAASFVGEWSPWRITDGDILVEPPRHQKGKLILKRDRTFTLSILFAFGPSYDSAGTYRTQGNRIFLNYIKASKSASGKKTRQTFELELFKRGGQLWEDHYLTGDGSFIYVRPGKVPKLPHSEKNWPSFGDFY